MCIVGAIVGGGVLAAGATVFAGSQAANVTQNAANQATNVQEQALQQEAQFSAPYRNLGTSALPLYKSLLGLGPQGSAGIEQTLQNTPGYQFTLQQGLGATKNAASASGMALSGNTLEALNQYSAGLADQTYQNAVGNTASAVGLGQAAAAGQAQMTQQGANNLGNIAINQGNTLAGIYANETAGVTKAITGGINEGVLANTLQGLITPPGP